MARKSRKGAALSEAPAKPGRIWKTAAYARLSLEDGGRKDSDSIEVQAELIQRYIEQMPYLKLEDTYIDDADIIGLNRKTFNFKGFYRLSPIFLCPVFLKKSILQKGRHCRSRKTTYFTGIAVLT